MAVCPLVAFAEKGQAYLLPCRNTDPGKSLPLAFASSSGIASFQRIKMDQADCCGSI